MSTLPCFLVPNLFLMPHSKNENLGILGAIEQDVAESPNGMSDFRHSGSISSAGLPTLENVSA